MFMLYKNTGPGGNGEFIIFTDIKDPEIYLRRLCSATMAALNMFKGDEDFTINGILPDACRIFDKIINHTKSGAHWCRSGYTEDFTHCVLVYSSQAVDS